MATPILSKPMKLIVAIASYDECGSDSLTVDAARTFDNSASAARFIARDLNGLVGDMGDAVDFEKLKVRDVNERILKLKKGENKEWQTPEGTPCWTKWKVFRKG